MKVGEAYIDKVKDTPAIPFDEEFKGLIEQLESIFGDEPIGTFR